MKELTDKELDELFKAAARGLKPDYDADSWKGIAGRLDNHKALPGWQKWVPLLFVGGIMFLSGLWIGRNMNSDLISTNAQTPETISEHSQLVPSENYADNKNQAEQVLDFGNRSQTEVFKESYSSEDEAQPQPEEPVTESIVAFIPEKRISSGKESNVVEAGLPASDSVVVMDGVMDSIVISKEPEDKPEVKKGHELFIRFLASPDLSAIEFGPARLGSSFGVMGEFSFTSRLSISSGVIRSVKNYESYQQDAYTYSSRYLTGSCHVLDIPVNLTYYFPLKKRFSLYVSAGVSSYLMLSEDYVYTVKTSTGDRVYPYQVTNENNEWFKVLNLSAGLQYRVAPRWHIQVEPFLKAPFADLGAMDVRLSSYGVFGAIRYHLKSIKKNDRL